MIEEEIMVSLLIYCMWLKHLGHVSGLWVNWLDVVKLQVELFLEDLINLF